MQSTAQRRNLLHAHLAAAALRYARIRVLQRGQQRVHHVQHRLGLALPKEVGRRSRLSTAWDGLEHLICGCCP